MSREIKFRGWDKEHKRWASSAPTLIERYHITLPNVELMQFTGLLDKQGKEIYEGDIVRYNHATVDGGFPINRVGYFEYEVSKYHSRVHIVGIGEKELSDYMFFPNCEVIGNIYSNPELLKED